MYTNLHTKIFTLKHGKFEKILWRDNDFFTTFDKYYIALKRLKTQEFWQNTNFLGLKRQKIVRMHKTSLTSQFLRLLLARFSRVRGQVKSN